MIRILYVNDDPINGTLGARLREAGVEVEILVAKKEVVAREYLAEADRIDVVLMDFDMGKGRAQSTVATGLVQAFVDAGFGKSKKMLVANSRGQGSNQELEDAGCSHTFHPEEFNRFADYLRNR